MNSLSEYEQQAIDFLKSTNTALNIEFKEFGSMPWGKDIERNIFKCTLSNSNNSYAFSFGSSLRDSLQEGFKIDSEEKTELYIGVKTKDWYFLTKIETCFSDLKAIDENRMNLRGIYKQERILKEIETFIDNAEVPKAYKSAYNKREFKNRLSHTLNIGSIEQAIGNKIKSAIESAKKEKCLMGQNKEIKAPTNYDILACLMVDYSEDFNDFCDNFGYDNDSIKAMNAYEDIQEESEALKALFDEEQLELLHEIS